MEGYQTACDGSEVLDSQREGIELYASLGLSDGPMEISRTSPDEPWWIEDAEILPESDLNYLCGLCRHINFSFLLQKQNVLLSTSSNSDEKCFSINLGPLAHTLQRAQCSFCKLIIWKVSKTRVPHQDPERIFTDCQQIPNISPDSSVKLSVVTRGSSKCSKLRIRISSSHKSEREDYFLQEIGNDPGQGRVVSRKIDWSLPRSWLEACQLGHAERTDTTDWGSLSIDLDFIDTRDSCITTIVRGCRYAALSYVWGGNQSVQLNRQTERLLRTKNGIKKVRLPETIRDAIRLTKNLGLRYLWVDSICIVQDDKKRRDRLLANMGWIYENATVTIVAVANKSARQGLPGMKSVTRTVSQIVVNIQGMKLTAVVDDPENPLGEVKTEKWSTRGWTFQEGLLSQRLLYLTSRQMIFVCKHATSFEDTNDPVVTMEKRSCTDNSISCTHNPEEILQESVGEILPESQEGLLRDDGWRWDTYCQLVEEYSQRNFTYQEDIFPAMAGILKRLSLDLPLKYLFNLPETEMDEALLWQPQGNAARRVLTSDEYIPSWSWAGWEGAVTYGETGNHPPDSSMVETEHIFWPVHSEMRWLVEDTYSMDEIEINSQDVRLRGWKDIGWKHTTIREGNFLRYYYFHDNFPGSRFLHPVALAASHKPKVSLLRDSSALCFMALTATIRLFENDRKQVLPGPGMLSLVCPQESKSVIQKGTYCDVFDTAGFPIGTIKLMSYDRDFSGNLELIALSRCNTNNEPENVSRFHNDPLECSSYFKKPVSTEVTSMPDHPGITSGELKPTPDGESKYSNEFYCLFNVMAVEMKDGAAYRIGLGKVHIDGFHTAVPEWKRIELR